MTPYILLFFYFAAGALLFGSARRETVTQPGVLFTAGAIIMTALIGLRYQVGGDWISYLFIYDHAGSLAIADAMSLGDPGYQFINWISYQLEVKVWLVNLISGALFVSGLFRFSRTQPDPWLAVLVAIPYMVIVVAMGYTRQSVALGFLMAGIADVLRGSSVIRFALYVVAAALFHKTAVVAFPLVAFAIERNRFVNFLVFIALVPLLYDLFLGNSMDDFVQNYIHTPYSSQGAAIRIAMNVVAVLAFWLRSGSMQFGNVERRMWMNFSLASIAAMAMLVLFPSSAAIDRLSLYLIPLQIAILGRLPKIFRSRLFGTTVVVGYCLSVELVWLNFAQFASKWLPYHFYPV